ncbi:hypothetical protein BU16DRAFT_221132 [Lophium mytilinum]|uniref:FHA domain-containing protein n=1 Tax=Lophium mytilinum TaxID=390894 RepID=A0A6A6QBL6_9PEZI|nr:hypothetical protein BU16DRAFT_221132 [Lophium mytilinum]
MTAVAPPPNFQPISRTGWSAPNGAANGLSSVNGDEFRMYMPRKSIQRPASSTSLASNASSNSTISTASTQSNGVPSSPAVDANWGTRKKPQRGLWPTSKAEPISGLSTARPQSIASASSTSAASAISALHSPAPMVPSQQHNGQSQTQQNGAPRAQGQSESPAILHLIPMNGTFERKTITVPFFPDVLRIGRQTNNKTIPTPLNGYFDSKVLSRQHAEIWADRNGKIWIRDVKSSNGTFVNGQRLSQENRDSDPHELREQDMLELGIDIVSEDQKTIVHHKVAARVEHAGIYTNTGNNMLDLNFGELDSPMMANIISPGGPQGMGNMRGRPGGQGQMNGNRVQTPSSAIPNNIGQPGQQRHMNFWLQPISLEQIVKKLNTEMKQAKIQNQDLQRTNQYIDNVLTTEPKKESAKTSPTSHVKISPIKGDIKARFSDPPAPPPQQPLPEKPDGPPHQPILRRIDTERPKSSGSPIRTDSHHQISSLAEALTTAKKEIESQGLRLKDLETLLAQERLARESAEERAQRLELERKDDTFEDTTTVPEMNGVVPDPEESEPVLDRDGQVEKESSSTDSTTSRLQQRLELMVAEMDEMKSKMEQYRQRAETAEAESETHRKTLSEMVEKIRHDDANRARREAAKQHKRSQSELSEGHIPVGVDGSEDEGEIPIVNDNSMDVDDADALLRRVGIQNGRAVSPEQATAVQKANSQALAQWSNAHGITSLQGASATSILVVVLGFGVMSYLNNFYPKVER